MKIRVNLFSYFRDLAGTSTLEVELSETPTVAEMLDAVGTRYPQLAAARRSTLVAIGVEYADSEQVIQKSDEISLFPPVQGG